MYRFPNMIVSNKKKRHKQECQSHCDSLDRSRGRYGVTVDHPFSDLRHRTWLIIGGESEDVHALISMADEKEVNADLMKSVQRKNNDLRASFE